MKMSKFVIGIGEALWDCLPEGRKIGGAPANFAYHVSQFGLQSKAVSAIGDDDLGHELEAIFKDIHDIQSPSFDYQLAKVNYPTGTVQVTLDEKGIPQYDICENVAWDNIPYDDALRKLAANTQAVCFGSLAQRAAHSRATIHSFLGSIPADALRVFDINLRQSFYSREIIEESLHLCNVLKINDEELVVIQHMFGYYDLSAEATCRRMLNDFDLRMLILTCGVEGSYVFSHTETSFLPTPKVTVADTVGAGDSFTGSFVAQILRGKSIREAHQTAVKVSAFVCTQNGAMPVIPAGLKD